MSAAMRSGPLVRSAHSGSNRLDPTAEIGQASKQTLDGLAGVVAVEVFQQHLDDARNNLEQRLASLQ